ncbi:MAG: hypothetical protein LBV30_00730 [Propionibacteriaceae bacterium]|jgi:hypothetical protein|nr:hypothetical protein [Propionibacteriaceae bacterium]
MTDPTAAGPLALVLAAFDGQVRSTAQISSATGLPAMVVEAAIEHLLTQGRLQSTPLVSGCSATACGSCALLTAGCAGAKRA